MKIVKTTIVVLLLIFLGFVGWMNATPGHFYIKPGCCSYATLMYDVNENRNVYCLMGCSPEAWENMKRQNMYLEKIVLLEKLDFNK